MSTGLSGDPRAIRNAKRWALKMRLREEQKNWSWGRAAIEMASNHPFITAQPVLAAALGSYFASVPSLDPRDRGALALCDISTAFLVYKSVILMGKLVRDYRSILKSGHKALKWRHYRMTRLPISEMISLRYN